MTVYVQRCLVLPENPANYEANGYTYTFTKWAEYTDGMKVTGDEEFNAEFTATPITYTVTLKNGEEVETIDYTIETETFALASITREGYASGGWFDNEEEKYICNYCDCFIIDYYWV